MRAPNYLRRNLSELGFSAGDIRVAWPVTIPPLMLCRHAELVLQLYVPPNEPLPSITQRHRFLHLRSRPEIIPHLFARPAEIRCGRESFEPQHRIITLLDPSMVLLNESVDQAHPRTRSEERLMYTGRNQEPSSFCNPLIREKLRSYCSRLVRATPGPSTS